MSAKFAGSSTYSAPAHKSSLDGSNMNDGDSVGVGSGLSALQGFDSEAQALGILTEQDPANGFSPERITENPKSTSASKFGKSFDIV
jgi:hypothetical protein